MSLDEELSRITGEDQLGASISTTAKMMADLYHELVRRDVPAQSATIIIAMYMSATLTAAAMMKRGDP